MASKNDRNYTNLRGLNLTANNGCLRFETPTITPTTTTDERLIYVNASDQLIYDDGSSATALGASGVVSSFSMNDAYDDGSDIVLDTAAVSFSGASDAAINMVEITLAGAGTGNMIDIQNDTTGTAGYDIIGTDDTWYFDSAGAALIAGITGCDTIVAAANLSLDATGTGTIGIGETSTGAVTITPALTAVASVTITGSADADVLTVTAGDVNVKAGILSLDDDDTATGNLVIPSSTATSGNPISVTADDLTSGAAIYVDSDNGASFTGTGGYLNFYNGSASVFHVGRYGALTIAGNASGTDSIVITAGDITMTSGDCTLTSGDIVLTSGNFTMTSGNALLTSGNLTLTAGNIVNTLGDLTLTAGDFLMTVGDVSIVDGSITMEDADNASSFVLVNDTITTADLVDISSDSITSGSLMKINADGTACDGTMLEIVSSGDTTSTPTGLSITIADVTTGVAKGASISMAKATTQAVGLTIDMAALTTGTGALITSAGTIVTTGELLSLVGNGATTCTGLLRASGTALTDGWVGQLTGGGATATSSGGVLDLVMGAATDGYGARIVTTGVYTGTVGALAVTATSATTGNIAVITGTGLTSGTALLINATEATLTSGFYIECNDAAASDFTVGKYGATVIAGNATGTDALTLTAGDITVTDGDVTMTDGDLLLTAGNMTITDGDIILTDGTILYKEKTEVVDATNAIGVAESGSTFFLNDATEFASTLPAPAAGLHYKFIVTGAPSGADYTIVSTSGTDNIHGVVCSAEDAAGTVDGSIGTPADTITFVASKALVGDWVEVVSDGTYWYARGGCGVQDAITFTQT